MLHYVNNRRRLHRRQLPRYLTLSAETEIVGAAFGSTYASQYVIVYRHAGGGRVVPGRLKPYDQLHSVCASGQNTHILHLLYTVHGAG